MRYFIHWSQNILYLLCVLLNIQHVPQGYNVGCAGEQYLGYLCNAQLLLLQVVLPLLEMKSDDV